MRSMQYTRCSVQLTMCSVHHVMCSVQLSTRNVQQANLMRRAKAGGGSGNDVKVKVDVAGAAAERSTPPPLMIRLPFRFYAHSPLSMPAISVRACVYGACASVCCACV